MITKFYNLKIGDHFNNIDDLISYTYVKLSEQDRHPNAKDVKTGTPCYVTRSSVVRRVS